MEANAKIKTDINPEENNKYSDRRKTSFLTDEMGEALVLQIKHENENRKLYKNFELWFSNRSLAGQAEYFHQRQHEEKNHAQWIIQWLDQADYEFEIPATPDMPVKFAKEVNEEIYDESLDIHQQVLVREIMTTDAINRLYEIACHQKDYITQFWLKKLLLEQAEEENLSHEALDTYDYSKDILIIDERFKKINVEKWGEKSKRK
jgi:ferritin